MTEHPDFGRFSATYKEERYDEALRLLDGLIAVHPQSAALRWHRANCLEKLERYSEIKTELDTLLACKPDYVPAIIKRVQYAQVDDGIDPFDELLSDAERERLLRERDERAYRISNEAEAELRRALALEPGNIEALLGLSRVLYYRQDAPPALISEAAAMLDHAILAAPGNVDLLDERANRRRGAALRFDDGPDDTDTIRSYAGQRFSGVLALSSTKLR